MSRKMKDIIYTNTLLSNQGSCSKVILLASAFYIGFEREIYTLKSLLLLSNQLVKIASVDDWGSVFQSKKWHLLVICHFHFILILGAWKNVEFYNFIVLSLLCTNSLSQSSHTSVINIFCYWRHPLQELCTSQFVSNDLEMARYKDRITVITGPNASGKSIYIKQVSTLFFLVLFVFVSSCYLLLSSPNLDWPTYKFQVSC